MRLLSKLSALVALGAALALPAVAQAQPQAIPVDWGYRQGPPGYGYRPPPPRWHGPPPGHWRRAPPPYWGPPPVVYAPPPPVYYYPQPRYYRPPPPPGVGLYFNF
ncbi:hypothetical protein [Falsiroseomonas sp. HW251]|uniref:hypothetical protein n=1 Tax=Falsiroseomonas sp. HW251 TaxID=3390998 RepID=UPI003D31E1F6